MRFIHLATLLTIYFFSVLFSPLSGQISLPSADFEVSTKKGCAPLTVQLTNISSNANQYEWLFGNGESSSVSQPSVSYTSGGVYDITLIAKDSLGNSDTLLIKNAVTVNDLPKVNFDYTIESPCLDQNKISFSNLSDSSKKYTWDFGDGNSSHLRNPEHSYSDSGSYWVKLLVSDTMGCSSFTKAKEAIQISLSTKLDFTVNDSIACDTSQMFSFYCSTDSILEWKWSFGNGDSSSLQNPKYSYKKAGTYDVSLITSNQLGCRDTLVKSEYIKVSEKNKLDFHSSTKEGCIPLTVDLYRNNANPKLNYKWRLSNGQLLSGDSVTATFTNSGKYAITLISEDGNRCIDSTTKSNFITAKGNALASFTTDSSQFCANGRLQFKNTSTGSKSYVWDFGDGNTSNLTNPTHTYAKARKYKVSLKVKDTSACSSTYTKSINIKKLEADFIAKETIGCLPLVVDFENLSLNADKWAWDFGDGDTSHQQHPTHTYQSSGKFNVSLIIETKSGCTDSISYDSLITVFNDTLKDNLSDTISACLPLPIDFSDNQIGSKEWTWNFGNGDTLNGKTPQYTYERPGIYTVSLKTYSSNGCPIYIENYATFKIDSIIPKLSAMQIDCENTSLQLTDSTENVTSWFWNFGDGKHSTLQSPIHKFPDTSVYNITLTLTTNNGCIHSVFYPNYVDFTNCLVGGEVVAAQGGGLPPDRTDSIKSSSNYAHRCAPQIVQLSNPDTNAFSWYWDFGDGDTSSSENPIHIYKRPGTYDVLLITENSAGKDTILWKDHITVNGPLANFSTQITHACDSAEVSFQNTSERANSWLWTFTKQITSTNANPKQKFEYSTQNHSVHLTVKDSIGCSSSKINILNFPKSLPSFNTIDTACVGDSIAFIARDSSYTYLWNFGDGSSIDSSVSPTHIYTEAGVYPIKVSSINQMGCETIHLLDSIIIRGSTANFHIIDTINCTNQPFSFIPKEMNANSYQWSVNEIIASNKKLPAILIKEAGEYPISLTIEKDGCYNSYTDTTAVKAKHVKADFTIEQLTNCYPIQIKVTDTNSNSNQWQWSIGNRKLKGLNQYSFNAKDSLVNITLKIRARNGCIDSISKPFTPKALSSNFEFSDSVGCAPLSIKFTNKSEQASKYFWDFGDGDTSSAVHPTHTYLSEGIYSVKLISESVDGCLDTTFYKHAIHVSSTEAKFSASYNSTCAPMMVNFINESTNSTSWEWNFGDGTTSKAKSPLNIYNNAGEYDVSLIASNGLGCQDTLRIKNQILVPGPITKFSVSDSIVCGIQAVHFTDSSINATEWNWFFGDGFSSKEQNPSHTYKTKGEYTITLKTKDSAGCQGYYTMTNAIKMDHAPKANFCIKDSIGCTPFELEVGNHSKNASNWKWNVSNDYVSTDNVPSHSFNQAGTYSISLKVENSIGCVDSMQFDSIIVLHTPNPTIEMVDPICENDNPIDLIVQEDGGKWSGRGIYDSIFGIYNPSLADSGFDTVIYSFQGACPASDTIQIKVKEAPKVDFTVNQTEACEKLEATFNAILLDSISSNLKMSYDWEYNGQSFGNTASVKNTFLPGVYNINLKVESSNGCSDESFKPSLIKVFDSIPSTTYLNRVSVVNNSEVLIEWHLNDDIAFDHYVLYRKSSSDTSFQTIKTFNDPKQTKFIDKALNTLNNSYCYKVISVDKCGQEIELNEAPFHCTINVATAKKDKNTTEVSWNKYIGCKVDYYEVLRLEKETNRTTVIAKVDANQLNFTDTAAYCNYYYSYRIRAKGSIGLQEGSLSDTSVTKMEGISQFQKSEIIRASVEDNSTVLVEWTPVDVASDFATGYVLHRSTDNKNYNPLTFIPIGNNNYRDWETHVDEERYFYKIEVINTCLNQNELTNTGSSILLKAKQIDDHSGEISWSEYEKWSEGIKKYEVQRLNEFNQWETIQILPPNRRQLIFNF